MAPTRQMAQSWVADGQVLVAGSVADKPARLVAPDEPLVLVADPPPFVSRGGVKLAHALDAFAIAPDGLRVLDVGASTGGFTDCLLQRGATEVVALDVGHGQLHEKIRNDARVVVIERCNVREFGSGGKLAAQRQELLGDPFLLVVVDVSFISLCTIAPALAEMLDDDGEMVALVKPQFEAGRREVAQGRGVVDDPRVWAGVLERVADGFAGVGLSLVDLAPSPLRGGSGNVEFLAHVAPSGRSAAPDVAAQVARAMRAVGVESWQ